MRVLWPTWSGHLASVKYPWAERSAPASGMRPRAPTSRAGKDAGPPGTSGPMRADSCSSVRGARLATNAPGSPHGKPLSGPDRSDYQTSLISSSFNTQLAVEPTEFVELVVSEMRARGFSQRRGRCGRDRRRRLGLPPPRGRGEHAGGLQMRRIPTGAHGHRHLIASLTSAAPARYTPDRRKSTKGSPPMPMSLEHLKVLDLTIHLSGPYCAMIPRRPRLPMWSRSNTRSAGTTCAEPRPS